MRLTPIILYRNDVDWKLEEQTARKHFDCYSSRVKIPQNSLVIPRFSALPFFKELEDDVKHINSKLINSYKQHQYIADLGNWYHDLHDYTPRTWRSLTNLPDNCSFVLKGETNSKKFLWNTHMFAKNKQQARHVYSILQQDSLLQYQNIYIREYLELECLGTGLQGLPISKEFRFFCYKDQILSSGFYWSGYDVTADPNEVPRSFLNLVIDKIQNTEICEPPNYYVIDVAKTKSGDWVVIELNDGTMSGLSENDPEELYINLKRCLS